jgi:hypothetical protein
LALCGHFLLRFDLATRLLLSSVALQCRNLFARVLVSRLLVGFEALLFGVVLGLLVEDAAIEFASKPAASSASEGPAAPALSLPMRRPWTPTFVMITESSGCGAIAFSPKSRLVSARSACTARSTSAACLRLS